MALKPKQALQGFLDGDMSAVDVAGHVSSYVGGISRYDVDLKDTKGYRFNIDGTMGNTQFLLPKRGDESLDQYQGRVSTQLDQLRTALNRRRDQDRRIA